MDRRLRTLIWPLAAVSFAIGSAFHLRHFLKFASAIAFARFASTYAWKMTNYSVNYLDFGFVKRGTLGCVVRWFAPEHRFVVASAMYLLGFVALVAVMEFRLRDLAPKHRNLIRILAIASPLGFQNLGFDFLRYDLFDLVLLGLGLILVERKVHWPLPMLVLAGILTHEGFVFYGVPALVACHLWVRQADDTRQREAVVGSPRRLDLSLALALLVVPLAAGSVAWFGGSAAVGKAFEEGTSPWTTGMIIEARPLSQWIGSLCVAATLLAVWIAIYRVSGAKLDWTLLLVYGWFGLLITGTDWARWTSLAFFAMLLAAPTLLRRARSPAPAPAPRWVPIPLVLLCVPLGPVGIIDFFPYIGFIAAAIH